MKAIRNKAQKTLKSGETANCIDIIEDVSADDCSVKNTPAKLELAMGKDVVATIADTKDVPIMTNLRTKKKMKIQTKIK